MSDVMPEMVPMQFRGHRFRCPADVLRLRRLEAISAGVRGDPTLTDAERSEILAIVADAQRETAFLTAMRADEPFIISGD